MLRRGTSIVEVLVAFTLAAIVLGSALGSLLRQRRATGDMLRAGLGRAQLRTAVAILPAQLALSSPSADDLAAGEARDTSLQLRVAVASGVTCDSGAVVTIDVDDGAPLSGGAADTPHPGDSLWTYDADSLSWRGRLVTEAWADFLSCPVTASGGRRVLRLRADGNPVVPSLSPVRVTRQTRLAVYRSGDGTWQLGLREWSDASQSFAGPQPIAGPFQRVSVDGARTGFRYYDAAGGELQPATDRIERARVARIRFTGVLPPTSGSGRDSADVVLTPFSAP